MNFTAEKDDEAGRSDYLDIVTYLQKQSQIITNYMYGMADQELKLCFLGRRDLLFHCL